MSAAVLAQGALRWARASHQRGHFCQQPEHAPTDYVFTEALRPDSKTPRDNKLVEKRACGICWPQKVGKSDAAG